MPNTAQTPQQIQQPSPIQYITATEFLALEKEVKQLTIEVKDIAINMNTFINHLTKYMDTMIGVMAGKTPEGSVPMKTHVMFVKGILWAFSLIIIAAIGAAKVVPILLD